jgi:Uri superfamily endonuclease
MELEHEAGALPAVACAALPAVGGTYALVLRVRRRRRIVAGRLGELLADAGHYVYVGSAFGSGGLRARLGRHVRASGRRHWHVDHLRAVAEPVCAWYLVSGQRLEHHWARAAARRRGAVQPFAGFGSSDCDCWSYLCYFPRRLPAAALERAWRLAARQAEARAASGTQARIESARRVTPMPISSTVG